MTPRMKSSKKWTAFPKEYSTQIEAVFRENFTQFLSDATLIVDGRIYQQEIMLRVGYRKEGELKQANFEASIEYSATEKDALEKIHNCIDATASMMHEFLDSEGEVDFPYTWKEIPFQNSKIYLQFTTENSTLEEEANKLLGLNEGELVVDETEKDEDALSRASETIEAGDLHHHDEDDEQEDDEEILKKGPQMFGGLPKKKKENLH